MPLKQTTKNRLSAAAIFAASWFATVLIAKAFGIEVDLASESMSPIWISYFAIAGVASSPFIIESDRFSVGQLRMILSIVLCVGIFGAVIPAWIDRTLVPVLILAASFSIIGYLFAIALGKAWHGHGHS
jgi:hypothetical protein